MTTIRLSRTWTAGLLSCCAALAACNSFTSSGEIERSGSASGSGSGFSSVFVNGTRFDTADAIVTVNGQTVSESALAVGMQLDVDGDLSAGTATSVSFDRTIRGPIDAIDRPDATPVATLTVLGQPVRVDELTVFDGSSLEALTTTMLVDVSALRDGQGGLVATWLRPVNETFEPTSTTLDVEGVVSNLTPSGFDLADLQVSATAVDTAGLTNGSQVEVIGRQTLRGGPLAASAVRRLMSGAGDGPFTSLQGIIGEATSSASFTVNGVTIDGSGADRLDATGLPLAAGLRVIVAGRINGDGSVTAARLTALPAADLGLIGEFQGQDAAAGTLQLLGRNIRLASTALYLDLSVARERTFGAASIDPGDSLHVLGHTDRDGVFVATRVERLDPSATPAVRGVVASPDANLGTFEIGMLPIATSGSTVFRDADNAVITAADFFNNLGERSFARVQGGLRSDGVFAATEVRQQDRGGDTQAIVERAALLR